MNRRFTWFGRFHGSTLLALLWASQLLAIPPGAAYLGQKPPGEKPERFAPGILSANPFLGRLAFSPDGKECFFTISDATFSTARLFMTRYANGAWTPQVEAPFTAGFDRSAEPFFTPDGNRLYFTARTKGSRTDIWMVDRSPQGWSAPTRLPAPINSDANEWCFSRVPDGTMYFASERTGTSFQLYRARQKADQSFQVELIPAPVLSVGTYEADPCVAPDGRFLVFGSARAGTFGAMDLHVSFPDGKGEWTKPVNLGADFNTAANEFGPTLSPDGKYLFFVRHDGQKGEIYWVSTGAIEKLRSRPAASANVPAAATSATAPTRAYVVQGKPSAMVQDHEAMLALALQLEKDLTADLEKPVIEDRSSRQRIYAALYGIAMLKKDHAQGRRYLELVRGLQESPTGRLLTGVITIPYMQAMEKPGPDFHATYRALLSARLAELPYEDVHVALDAMKEGLAATSKEALIGSIEAGLDPVVKDGQLGPEMASGLVSTAMNLEVILPVKDDVVTAIEGFLRANKPTKAAANPAGRAPQAALGVLKVPMKGPYFGQALPGETPVPFAPGSLTSMHPWVEGVVFSPDGALCFMGVGDASYSSAKLYLSSRVNEVWAPFAEAPFVSDFTLSGGPAFSADGKTVTFSGTKATGSRDLWTVSHSGQRWGTPAALPSPINSDDEEYPASTMADGTIYFSRAHSGLRSQVYKAHEDPARTWAVELLGAPVNAQSYEGDPCIAPDGRFLVFYSARIGGQGGTDLYVSFRDGHGGWGTPLNLGTKFNSPNDEYGAHLSSDGKYLFFTRHGSKGNTIYWVETSAIDQLKPSSA